MNKTLEYMAFELPVVAFDLIETRVSAGRAAVYAEPNRVEAYAQAIVELLADEPRRGWMGALGRRRIEDELAWSHQGASYLSVYEQMFGLPARRDEPRRRTLRGRRLNGVRDRGLLPAS